MTTMTLPSASVLAKKASLLEKRSEWVTVRYQGMRRIIMPNETGSRVYRVDPTGKACNCKAGQFGTLCAHRLAAIEAANHDALAAWVDDQEREQAPKIRPTIEELWPSCWTDGCDNDPEPHSGGCHEHMNSEAF